jgi:hypothetical protein
MIDFSLQTVDERFDLQPQTEDALAADDLGIDDRTDAANRFVEIVVHDNVLVLLDCL